MANTGKASVGVDVTVTSTTLTFALGNEANVNGNLYRFVLASAAISAGDALKIDTTNVNEPNAMIPVAAVNDAVAAIAPVAIASGSYGWVVTRGNVDNAKVAASTAAGAQLGASATAGTLSTITISATYVQAEIQRVLGAAAGRCIQALDPDTAGVTQVHIS